MSQLTASRSPLIGLGMASTVLGVVGLMLFILPILGIPISAFGLCFGILGFVLAPISGARLRWSAAGIAVSLLALAVNLAIYYAPEAYLPGRNVPLLWQPAPDRPYVPPPASSDWAVQ